MEWETFALVVTMILMAISLVLVVVPVLPGTVIMWAVATFYGLILGWEQLGWTTFFILTVLMAIGVAADIFAGHVGAKVGGASWLARMFQWNHWHGGWYHRRRMVSQRKLGRSLAGDKRLLYRSNDWHAC